MRGNSLLVSVIINQSSCKFTTCTWKRKMKGLVNSWDKMNICLQTHVFLVFVSICSLLKKNNTLWIIIIFNQRGPPTSKLLFWFSICSLSAIVVEPYYCWTSSKVCVQLISQIMKSQEFSSILVPLPLPKEASTCH
jgi:hypothetical protein